MVKYCLSRFPKSLLLLALGCAMFGWTVGCGSAPQSSTNEKPTAADASLMVVEPAAVPASTPAPVPTAVPADSPAASSESGLPVYRCPRVVVPEGGMPMDLDAEPWKAASLITPFRLADASGPSTLQTEAKMVYDDEAFHILFRCQDPNIWNSFTRHNDPIFKEEVVEVFLDLNGDQKEYFEFELSPADIRFAVVVKWDNGRMNLTRLDPLNMDTRIQVDGTVNVTDDVDRQWIAYMKLPFSYLGCSTPPPGTTWKGNLYRIDRAEPTEFSCWSPTHTSPAAFHRPKYFGTIEFASAPSSSTP